MPKNEQHNANNKTLLKNAGIIGIGTMSTKAANFLLLPLYTALIGTEEYGTIDLLNTYATLLMAVANLQVNQAIFRFVAVDRDEPDKVKQTLSTLYALTVGSLLVYSVLTTVLFTVTGVPYQWYLLLQVLANIFFCTVTNTARGLGDNALYAFTNFLSALVSLVLSVVFLAVFHWAPMTILWAYILGPLVGGAVAFLWKGLWKYLDLRAICPGKVKQYLRYSVPLIPNELSWWVVHASDRTIISTFLGVGANGLIAVASKFSNFYLVVFNVFNTAWTEQCVLHFFDKDGPAYVRRTMVMVIKFFSSLTILIIAFTPFGFAILVNRQYDQAYGLVPVYLVAVFFNMFVGLVNPIYLIHNETGKAAKSMLAAAAMNITVDLLLVSFIGAYAAPVSSLCAYLVVALWRMRDVQRHYLRVDLPLAFLARSIAVLAVVIAGYYAGNLWVQILCAALSVGYGWWENRPALAKGMALVKSRLRTR